MGLRLTVLGSAGTWASAESACSGYLVTDGTTRIWVDCGPGTMQAIQRHCSLTEIDAVVATHQHPDHWVELPVLRNAYIYGLDRRDVPLYAPMGVFEALEGVVGRRGVSPPFLPKMVGEGSVARVGDLRLRFSRTDHPVETVAVRIDHEPTGASIAYSSDTGPGWSIAELRAGIDLAVVEATFLAAEVGDPPPDVHRTAAATGADAKAAGVGRLVITHVPPGADGEARRVEAEAAFGGPVELARPHETYEVQR